MSVYVYAKINLRYGALPEFNEAMARLRPVFEDLGWKLTGGWSTLIGDLHEVHDLWEVADANAVTDALVASGGNPVFAEVAPDLARLIERETLSLVTKTPYSDA